MPLDSLDAGTRVLLKDYRKFFDKNPEAEYIEPTPFTTYFHALHPKLEDAAKAVFSATIKGIAKPAPPGTEDGIRERLTELATATKLKDMLDKFEEGEGDLSGGLRFLAEQHENWTVKQKKRPKVRDRIEDMLDHEANDVGFHFRLNVLNEVMRPLWEGDFLITAARVDSGKSTWFASELTFMAAQIKGLYPGRHRPIVIFNNEGPGRKLRHRCFNSALGLTNTEMVEARDKGKSLFEMYVEAQGGEDYIEIYDVHDYTMGELEDIVKELDPCIVVIDMLDNVKADVAVATNGGTRTDQLLEWMYQRARVWAVKYNCVVIATSQLNGDADGEVFPKLSMLANSKTGKAGAADAVLMLGRSNNADLQNTRFISTPKNKKRRDGAPQDPRREVTFDGPRARFRD